MLNIFRKSKVERIKQYLKKCIKECDEQHDIALGIEPIDEAYAHDWTVRKVMCKELLNIVDSL